MTATTVRIQLKNRTDTASAWSSANPTPLKGELCFESDTNKIKIGDGSTAYNSLSYFTGGSLSTSGGTLLGDLLIDNDKILKLFEADGNGTAFVGIKGATDKGAEGSYTISLPAAAPAVNQVLKAGSSTATDMVWAAETDTTYTAGSGLTLSGTTFSVNAVALTTVQEAANESAQLALTAQEGDVVVRTDENKSYVHNGGTANSMADYTLLRTPTDSVLSVNGNTGAISASDIATAVEAASDSNTFTDADHTKLNGLTSTPEGTAILSTGESSGSKFLREDGDGSCSWQTVAATTPTDITVADESSDTSCNVAFFTAATGDLAPKTGTNLTFNSSTGNLTATKLTDEKGDVRNVPKQYKTAAYTLVASDAGKCITVGGAYTVTIPYNVMSDGDVVTIVNNHSAAITIARATNVILTNAADGTDTNKTLAAKGMVSMWFMNTGHAYISGAGLS